MRAVSILMAMTVSLATVSACEKRDAAPVVKSRLSPSAECSTTGGKMIKGPLNVRAPVCVHLFPDRGKVCSDSKQCQGQCRYADRSLFADPMTEGSPLWNGELQPLPSNEQIGKAGVGHCQWSDDDGSGCSGAVEGGKLQEWTCID